MPSATIKGNISGLVFDRLADRVQSDKKTPLQTRTTSDRGSCVGCGRLVFCRRATRLITKHLLRTCTSVGEQGGDGSHVKKSFAQGGGESSCQIASSKLPQLARKEAAQRCQLSLAGGSRKHGLARPAPRKPIARESGPRFDERETIPGLQSTKRKKPTPRIKQENSPPPKNQTRIQSLRVHHMPIARAGGMTIERTSTGQCNYDM